MTSKFLAVLALAAWCGGAPRANTPPAEPAPLGLGISGSTFTVNGQPRFLILVSDFDALDAPSVEKDFAYLASRVDGVRIFANWWDFGPGRCPLRFSSRTVIGVDPNGKAIVRPDRLARLQSVLDAARSHGLVVDLTFAADPVEGLSTLHAGADGGVCKPSGTATRVRWDEYGQAIASLARSLRATPSGSAHVFFDLQNEWGHPVNGATEADLSGVVKAVRAADPDRLLTISSFEPDASKHAGVVQRLHLSGLNFHDFPRGRGWGSRTADQVARFREALASRGVTVPIYDGEPDPAGYGQGLAEFEASLTGARKAGAAAWTFHTRAGHELDRRGLVDALDPDARRFLEEARSVAGRAR